MIIICMVEVDGRNYKYFIVKQLLQLGELLEWSYYFAPEAKQQTYQVR